MRRLFFCLLLGFTFLLAAPRLISLGTLSQLSNAPIPVVAQVERRYTILGYQRAAFGSGWGPAVERPACTAREHAIASQTSAQQGGQSGQPENRAGTPCKPTSGYLADPYTQRYLDLVSQPALEVDHVFPLSAAWDMGAYDWDYAKRLAFANDPLNLVVTDRATNQDKSDQLPSRWMPPDRRSHCWYAHRLAAVAKTYDLPLPRDDLKAMHRACRLGIFR